MTQFNRHYRWLFVNTLVSLSIAGTTMLAASTASPSGDRNLTQARGDQRAEHRQFDDHDRQMATQWYEHHRTSLPVGLRDRDRLSVEIEPKFTAGFVIGADLRSHIHPVPNDLLRDLGVPPRGLRYVFIDGHLALIDDHYTVVDVIHLGHDGR